MPLNMYHQESRPSSSPKHIFGIAAGKGGVGKSTVAVNLARTLKWCGYSVGIMDTDIYGPSIRKMLQENRLPQQQGETIIPAWCEGLRMISMAYFRKEQEAAVVRAPIANGIISQFIKNVDWSGLDVLLIDFPPGTGDIQLTLCQQANLTGAIMVTTPQEISVMDVRKAMHMFHQVKVPVIGVIENMSFYFHEATQEKLHIFGKGGGERLARESGAPFLGFIPIDPEICQCGDNGHSLFKDAKNDSLAVQCYKELAGKIMAQAELLKEQTKNNMENFELIWKQM